MTMTLTFCVTMVRWVDVPDSDRGDFGRRCVIDISSFLGVGGQYIWGKHTIILQI